MEFKDYKEKQKYYKERSKEVKYSFEQPPYIYLKPNKRIKPKGLTYIKVKGGEK